MRIIEPSVEILHSGLEKEYILPEKLIERVGRTCYKSEDKITEDSAAKFVSGLIKRGHEAMIEHYNFIFKTDAVDYETIMDDWDILMHNGNHPRPENYLRPFLRFTDTFIDDESRCIISGNVRAWRDFMKACQEGFGFLPRYLHGIVRCYPLFFPEFQDLVPAHIINDILIPIHVWDLKGDFEQSVHHNITVKFICDRGVSHEIVRHRPASYAQESTRYCNYGLGKFGGEITVIEPAKFQGFSKILSDELTNAYIAWSLGCRNAEEAYFKMLETGCTPQEARSVLPNSLKTEIIVTNNADGWDHFFNLRCAPDAHPDIQVVAKMARDEFAKLMPERYAAEGANRSV